MDEILINQIGVIFALIVGLVSRRFLVIEDHMIWNYRTQLEDIAAARNPTLSGGAIAAQTLPGS